MRKLEYQEGGNLMFFKYEYGYYLYIFIFLLIFLNILGGKDYQKF